MAAITHTHAAVFAIAILLLLGGAALSLIINDSTAETGAVVAHNADSIREPEGQIPATQPNPSNISQSLPS